jgi:hypothetical protein
MSTTQKPKISWIGLVVFVYSVFLLLQGIWVWANYVYLYPVLLRLLPGYVPNNNWVFQMIGAIAPSVIGGIIFMTVGWCFLTRRHKPRPAICLSVLCFSIILLVQSIWILYIFPNYHNELLWYLSTSIFTNFPRFFLMLGVLIPPIVGFVVFLFTGLFLTKAYLKRKKSSDRLPLVLTSKN